MVTHEGLTTMAHSSRVGWTILSGPWNHLRKVWGHTPYTLARIQASCKSQESLEEANLFTHTRHLLLVIKRTWQLDRIHGLPAVSAPVSFPSDSKGDECWWGTRDLNTVYLCDPWRTRIDEAHWKPFTTRTIGWYGRQKATNGHTSYSR